MTESERPKLELPFETIGKITVEWTILHFQLRALLIYALKIDFEVADAIMSSASSDQAKRKLALAAVESSIKEVELKSRARELIQGIDALAGKRNDFVHSLWFHSDEKEEAMLVNYGDRKSRIVSPNKEAKELCKEMLNLRIKIARLADDLSANWRKPKKD